MRKYCLLVFSLLCLCAHMCISPFIFIRKAFAEVGSSGRAECVIECDTGRILYESRGDFRLPMASTTKIATAATVLRLCDDLQEVVIIPEEAAGIEGSSVYLKAGDCYTVEDLLYGLMLRSGNDCATTLALHFGGSLAHFASDMNRTAQMAGALHTRFSNPHGLPAENHYTTVRDLCYITRFAMKDLTFQKIVSTQYYAPRNWKNKNKMLYSYEGGIGVKTGYTKEAGRCLVSAAKRNGMTLICTVLNCSQMYERSSALLDDAFDAYQMQCLMKAGTLLPVQKGDEKISGCVKEDFYYPLSDGEKEQLEIKTRFISSKNKEIIGQFAIYLSKRLLFSGNLYKL